MRGETEHSLNVAWLLEFQSTLPMRGETLRGFSFDRAALFQSTLPMRGETGWDTNPWVWVVISIHSPHAGRDGCAISGALYDQLISIHSPHAGRDFVDGGNMITYPRFQSTLPMRGETGIQDKA